MMDANNKCVPRRQKILKKLKERNSREKRYAGIVRLCNSLHETVDFAQKENARLLVQNAKLQDLQNSKAENAQTETVMSQATSSEAVISSLQKKVYELQQELTNLHRNKGEHGEQAILLQKAIDERKKDILYKNNQIEELRIHLDELTAKCNNLEEKSNDANRNLQLVKDEYSALSITYTSLQKSTGKLKEEHEDLLERWKVYKVQVAEDLERENELIRTLKNVRIQKELAEAVQEPAISEPGPSSRKSFYIFKS